MKRLLIFLICLPLLLQAQNIPLIVEGIYPNLYLNHTVHPKENYYSIGRLYNVSPKEIAPFNKLELANGLTPGQLIKIPLTRENFLQTGSAVTGETLIPLHHMLRNKEGLYRVSVNYNKLPIETLKKWNNIKGESVANGTDLIIGYLKVKKDLSSFANNQIQQAVATTVAVAPLVKEISDAPQANEAVKQKVKETPLKPTVNQQAVTPQDSRVLVKNFNGGIFKKDFDKQASKQNVVNETGGAAIFKSNSGWEDGKYYCLHNTAEAGTIIKITNTETGKSVYAKVLDVIPDIKQNAGLLIRLSNAAAQELEGSDAKFDCTLTYSK